MRALGIHCTAFLLLVCNCALADLHSAQIASKSNGTGFNHSDESESGWKYQTNVVEGWTVVINKRLVEEDSTATDKALELLGRQLRQIEQVVPAPAVAKLREVTLWFSPPYPSVIPKAEYHPGAGWLREHGRNPEMVKGVEFTNIRIFEAETERMPNFALHELSHAYHDRFLPDGFENAEIKAAYERAKTEGLYDKVDRWAGKGRPYTHERAYAMTNPMEFFAELSEAFFARNDFYPFTREELKQHDRETDLMLAKVWGKAE